jgi:hypothetical protein
LHASVKERRPLSVCHQIKAQLRRTKLAILVKEAIEHVARPVVSDLRDRRARAKRRLWQGRKAVLVAERALALGRHQVAVLLRFGVDSIPDSL